MKEGEFVLLAEPSLALKQRLALIRAARSRVQAQYYSWAEDGSGKLLLAELLCAARRGVRVQLLIDDLYAGENRFLEMVACEPGIEVRLFNPFWLRGWRPLALLLEACFSFRRLNHRMHNKLLLVDGNTGILGGRNIGDAYFGLGAGPHFLDLDIGCRGPLCQSLEQGFDQFWCSRWSQPVRRLLRRRPGRMVAGVINDFLLSLTEPTVAAIYDLPADLFEAPAPLTWHPGRAEVLFDRPGKGLVSRPGTARYLWRRLGECQGMLQLVSPYLILTRGLRRELQRLRRQGIAIRLLTNSLASTDVPLVHGAYYRHRPWLLRQGIGLAELPASSGLSLHAKLILLGEREALLGSFNLDPRSFHLNTELMLRLNSGPLCAELQAWLTHWQGVTAEPDPVSSWWRRLIARLSHWLPLRPWL
ncbi:phospholipase D family protein [Aeromonas sp. BIGb0445]|uniref:phospholipase D family protein n=1 Tax=Aeromonas sp. BIGb0445 TaxID=2940593 RepID=UPI0021674EB9|nr:phospholipase D family protein [Aeromonas sp. BIGb0445]MCS3461602.1 putative cardiolipin synthase [Aeromonas sp. BIGb0445]